jgi:hypothetical protein
MRPALDSRSPNAQAAQPYKPLNPTSRSTLQAAQPYKPLNPTSGSARAIGQRPDAESVGTLIISDFRRAVLAPFAILRVAGICGILIAVIFLPQNSPPQLWIESGDGFQFREWKLCLVAEIGRYVDFDIEMASTAAVRACMDKNVGWRPEIRSASYCRQLAKDAAILMKRRHQCSAGGGNRRKHAAPSVAWFSVV